MNRLLKIIQVLIFTVLLLVVGVFIWQFFNAYDQLLLLPLCILSIYYLLLYAFAKLLQPQTSKIWFYICVVFLVMPLIAFSTAYRPIIELSLNLVNGLTKQ